MKLFWGLYFSLISSSFAESITIGVPQDEPIQELSSRILREYYSKIGLNYTPSYAPIKRIEEMVSVKDVAGEASRIRLYFDNHPNFIKIEPSLGSISTTVFALKKKKFMIKRKEDLIGLKIGIRSGFYYAIDLTKDLPNVIAVESNETLYDMLFKERIDVAIDIGFNGKVFILKKKTNDIVPIAELAYWPYYHCLRPEYSETAKKLIAVLKNDEKNGKLKKLIKKIENDIFAEAQTGSIKQK